jgi:alpha-galactosidase
LRKEHPEWAALRDGQLVAGGRALDLTRPEVAAWCEAEIERLIRTFDLDMYRIDHNHTISPSPNRVYKGYTEDLTWRYYDALYAMFDRLRKKYPKVVFQNCAGGGGRLDWGTMARFHNAELSDWMRLPRGFKILNGVTMLLPPEVLLRAFGTEAGEHMLDGDVDSQLRHNFCRIILRGIAPTMAEMTEYLRERIGHYLEIYREHIRPIMQDGLVYHHTPFLKHAEATPWCVLEYSRKDRKASVAVVMRTSAAGEDTIAFRPRGLDPAQSYEVLLDNQGFRYRASGHHLSEGGIRVRLEQELASELLLVQAV